MPDYSGILLLMNSFWTEKQIEHWLQSETRNIVTPCGTAESITTTKLFWQRMDLMIIAGIVTMDQLLRYTALNMAGEKNYGFSDAFISVVSHIDSRIK